MAKALTGKGATGMSGPKSVKVGGIRTPFTSAMLKGKGGKVTGKR